jgi:hypothetical protein
VLLGPCQGEPGRPFSIVFTPVSFDETTQAGLPTSIIMSAGPCGDGLTCPWGKNDHRPRGEGLPSKESRRSEMRPGKQDENGAHK